MGALSLFGGVTLPRLLEASAGASRPAGRARAVILLNLFGGPPHIDMFDMKPDAPLEVRGEFKPIATSVPGLQICEHMPRVAALMHRASLVRTVSHGYNSHIVQRPDRVQRRQRSRELRHGSKRGQVPLPERPEGCFAQRYLTPF